MTSAVDRASMLTSQDQVHFIIGVSHDKSITYSQFISFFEFDPCQLNT